MFYVGAIDTFAAQGGQARYPNLLERTPPRHKQEVRVGRYNFYVVRRGFSSGLFFNWPDCEFEAKGFLGAQFKDFHIREEVERYLRA